MKRKPYRAARTSTTTRATRPREPERSDCTNRVKWDLYRREAPELSLERFPGADDLSFLWWGNPDAKLSIETYRKVQRSVATRNFSDAATDLLRLYKTSAATFHRSGWVCYTVGKLVLEDELATKRFLKTYRKLKRPKQKLLAAYNAVAILTNKEQRQHWVQALKWIRNLHEKYDRHKSEKRFTADAAVKYAESRDTLNIDVEALVAIATEVFQDPKLKLNVLVDHSVARYFGISHSTLTKTRANLKQGLQQSEQS